MIRNILIVAILFLSFSISAQVENPKFKRKIDRLLTFSVPTISVDELNDKTNDYLILDAREKEEFDVSRISNAQYIGYDKPDYSVLENVDKDQPIVIYCSIGYRSEKIGERLRQSGFTNVKNLYGSIFEWGNRSFPLFNSEGDTTKEIHTYNNRWAKWIDNPSLEKKN